MSERTVEDVLQEIATLNGQDDNAAGAKFMEIATMGVLLEDNSVRIMGLLNAAVLACNRGDYDFCIEIIDKAIEVDREICKKYLQEQPHMIKMIATLTNAGALG